MNEAHKQYNLLYTIVTICVVLDLQENIYKKVKKTYYTSAGFAGRLEMLPLRFHLKDSGFHL